MSNTVHLVMSGDPVPAHQQSSQLVQQHDGQLVAYKRAYSLDNNQTTVFELVPAHVGNTVGQEYTYVITGSPVGEQQQLSEMQAHHLGGQVLQHHHMLHLQEDEEEQPAVVVPQPQQQQPVRSGGERPYKCDQCTASFLDDWELVDHQKKHSEDGPFTCDECHFTFMYKSHFRSHKTRCDKRRASMPTQPPKPVVPVQPVRHQFPRRFITQRKSVKKAVTYVQTRDDDVGNGRTQSVGKGKRLKQVVPSRAGNAVQSRPSFNPINPSFKRSPKGNSVTLSERPFECNECDASFQNATELQTHAAKHTGEGPFKCEECRFVFLYRKLYDAHRRRCEKKRKSTDTGPVVTSSESKVMTMGTVTMANQVLMQQQPQQVIHHHPSIQQQQQHHQLHHQQLQMHQQPQSTVLQPHHQLQPHLRQMSPARHQLVTLNQLSAGDLQQHSIIDMRSLQPGQLQHSTMDQVILATPVSGGSGHEIKYDLVATNIDMENMNHIVNLIKVKDHNQ